MAVVGVAQTMYAPGQKQTVAEMVYAAVQGALADAGIGIGAIDYAVTASVDLWDGLTASNIAVTEVVGAVMRPEARVAGDGLLAAMQAYMVAASGHHDVVLLVAHAKCSATDHWAVSNWTFDPVYQQTLGVDYLVAAGLQADAYCSAHGIERRHLAAVVVKNRENGSRNPVVRGITPVSTTQVLTAPLLAAPLGELDCAPATDGACALVLAARSAAHRFPRAVWIQGLGYCQDAHYLGDRALAEPRALTRAARRAYGMAGVDRPWQQLSLAELSEPFSYQELMWMEGLGLAEPGQAWRLLLDGLTQRDGPFPVNPSGGFLGGSPHIVGGLARLAEAVLQIRGEAAGRQVAGASRAVVHGTTGACGQSHAVMVLGAGEEVG